MTCGEVDGKGRIAAEANSSAEDLLRGDGSAGIFRPLVVAELQHVV